MKKLSFICLFVLCLSIFTACSSDSPATKVTQETETKAEEQKEAATETQEEATTEEEPVEETTQEETKEEETGNEGAFTLGDKVQAENKLVFTLCGSRTSKGDDFISPTEGNDFLYIDMMVENPTDEEVSISSLLMFSLYDTNNQQYDIALASDANGSVDGTLFPGKRLRGELVYEIPENLTEMGLVILPDMLAEPFVIVFDKGTTVEPELMDLSAYEVASKTIGDTFIIGDVSYTLNKTSVSKGGSLFGPAEGNQYVVAEVTMTNNGSESTTISSLLMFSLVDEEGRNCDFAITETSGTVDGDIGPNETVTGEVTFEAAKDQVNFELHISDLMENDFFSFTLQ